MHVVPSDALDTATIISSAVQVDARVIGVVLPRSKNITGAEATVAALSAVKVPRSRGKVDRVAGVIHGDIDVEVTMVLVRGGALGTGESQYNSPVFVFG